MQPIFQTESRMQLLQSARMKRAMTEWEEKTAWPKLTKR
jgi:hypothetical protein